MQQTIYIGGFVFLVTMNNFIQKIIASVKYVLQLVNLPKISIFQF